MVEEYKYKYWVLTIKTSMDRILMPPVDLIRCFRDLGTEYTFQPELSTNGNLHYQCCFATKTRTRQSTLLKILSEYLKYPLCLLELDRAFDYEIAKKYCSDSGKRAPGTGVYSNLGSAQYEEGDIQFLDISENRFPWQREFMSIFFNQDETDIKTPDDRTVYWLTDSSGNSGKSKFTKWLVRRYDYITKIAFGTSTQLRSSVISEGPKRFYILDIPRTLGSDDSISSVISVIEDIKNGYVKSGMYGDSKELFLDPPHILVFTNRECPEEKLSEDRWRKSYINHSKDWRYF